MAAKKSGRNILTRLLPAFFILLSLCNGNLFASDSEITSCLGPDNFRGVCLANYDGVVFSWVDLPQLPSGEFNGDVVRLKNHALNLSDYKNASDRNRQLIPGAWPFYVYAYDIIPISEFVPSVWGLELPDLLSYPSANYAVIYAACFFPCTNGKKVRWIVKYYFHTDCLEKCKADLAAAKTSITADGQALLAAFTAVPGALPCNTTICLTGKEAMFQPMADGVLLLGSLASGLIVMRKRRKK